MHKTMVSVVSLGKIEIIRSQEFMPSEVRQKFLKKMIILGPKTAILGPQFCRIYGAGASFLVVRGAQAPRAPLDPPLSCMNEVSPYWLGSRATIGPWKSWGFHY